MSGYCKLNFTFFLLLTLLHLELLSEKEESKVYFFSIPFTQFYFEPNFELYEEEFDSNTLFLLTHYSDTFIFFLLGYLICELICKSLGSLSQVAFLISVCSDF